MSLLPVLLDELIGDYRRPTMADLYDQNFGIGLEDLLVPSKRSLIVGPLRSGYMRPWRHVHPEQSGISNVKNDKTGFAVNLDVQQFKPEELKVSVVDDFLVVEAKHEERCDEHGFISRQFTRRYKLPSDIDRQALTSKLSSDGVLSLEAPKKVQEKNGAREIPITHTNAPAVKQQEEGKTKPKD